MSADAWLFDVDLPAGEIAALLPLLDREERARAMRFRFPHDRNRFIARRGRLRLLLGSYLGKAAQDIAFRINDFGKPLILGDDGLQFSLSHSHGVALCAIAWDQGVGCDVEWRDAELASHETADRLFSTRERIDLRQLPSHRWVEGFYNCWTRKEAFVKAIGQGLSYSLESFDVSVAPGEPAVLLSAVGEWSLESFSPRAGLQAAVVVEGLAQPVRFRGTIPSATRSATRSAA